MNVGKGYVSGMAKITPQTRVELAGDAWIGDFVFVHLNRPKLGRGSQVNPFASLTGGGEIFIGDCSVVRYGVSVISGTDTAEGKYMADRAAPEERKLVRGRIKIGSNCFVPCSDRLGL